MSTDLDQKPIVIIGAGLSGLACALMLYKAGLPFLLLEESDYAGGRVKTDQVEGFLLDHGFQILLDSYSEASQILDFKSLSLKRFYSGALIRYKEQFHLVGDPLKSIKDIVKTIQAPIGTIKDKYLMTELIADIRYLKFPGDGESTLSFLQKYGFSEKIINTFFKPFFGGVFLEKDLNTSSKKFNFLFDKFSKGYACVPSAGMGAIPAQLVEQLPARQLRFLQKVVKIEKGLVTLASGELIEARAIVVATDPKSANDLLPELKLPDSYPVLCLYYSAPKSPVNKPVLVLNGEGQGPINNLAVMSDVASSYAPKERALISVTTLEDASHYEVESQLLDWFGSQVKDWELLKSYNIRYALPKTASFYCPPNNNVISPGIYLCGDYLELASIEGALVSGEKTASLLMDELKINN